MAVYADKANDRGGLLVSFITLVIIISCILLAAITSVNNHVSITSGNTAEFVKNQCKPNSNFAEASDYEGKIIYFCMLQNGNIGVLKYHNGKLVGADVINGNTNFTKLLDYISSLEGDFRLTRFQSGFIPAP